MRGLRGLVALAVLAAACDDDSGGTPDLTAGGETDLAVPADLAGAPDLSTPADLTGVGMLADLSGTADATFIGPWTLVPAITSAPTSLAISPNTGATPFNLFVGSAAGIFASSDGASFALAGPTNVVAVGAFPMAAVSWVSLGDGTVQSTSNSGASWGPIGATPPIAIVSWVSISGVGPFGGGSSGGSGLVANGKMGGASWTSSATFGTGSVRGLAYAGMQASKAVLLAALHGSGGGIFRSTDSGATFSATTCPLGDALSVATAPSSMSTVIAGANGGATGIYLSADSGSTWSAGGAGLANTAIESLAVDPTNASIVYAGTGAGVYRSADGGATFQLSGLSTLSVVSLAVENGTPSTVFAATAAGLFVTTTGGL
jgi:hypothetical protein